MFVITEEWTHTNRLIALEVSRQIANSGTAFCKMFDGIKARSKRTMTNYNKISNNEDLIPNVYVGDQMRWRIIFVRNHLMWQSFKKVRKGIK